MDISVTYERDWGIGWIAAEPALMQRACHALAHDGGVWLVDPVNGDGLEERIAPLGEVRGVLQLLDRHGRDGAELARRHGVPLLETPFDRVAGAPFEPIAVLRRRRWTETALWWPERRALVVAEALGTARYFPAPGATVGVHPALRLTPPRVLAGRDPDHLLVGHGRSLHGEGVGEAVRAAIERSRREIPRWLAGLPGARRRARAAAGPS